MLHLLPHTRAVVALTFLAVPAASIATLEHLTPTRAHKLECDAGNGGITLPKGFCAVVVADKLSRPRHLVVQANGDIFVSVGNGITALRDTTGDGKADIVQQWGGGFRSSEVAIRNGYLYTEGVTAIMRYPLTPGSLTPAGPVDTLIRGLPDSGHSAKTFALAADGTLYVNIGSLTNACQEKDRQLLSKGIDPCVERERRAGIWAFKTDRSGQTQADGIHFASGIRNAVAMSFNPTDRSLFVMQHGRDNLAQNWPAMFDEAKSAETPAEEMFNVKKGDDFGWPYCYFDRQLGQKIWAPEYGGDGKTAGKCSQYKGNVTSFPGHWAPNGMVFYSGKAFPARYRNGAFIAFHGSWNRAPLPQQGYNVVFQPMKNGKASGKHEVFANGFKPDSITSATPMRRPVGLAVGPDGSLYVADDASGRIWRVIYTGK